MSLFIFREPISAWTHGAWLLLCIPAILFLQLRARGNPLKHIGFAVFGVGLLCCFAGSWLYHAVRLSPEAIALCARLDYMGIFLLIAGTTTPIVLIVMDGWRRISMLLMMWGMAGTGILLRGLAVPLPEQLSTGVYIMMGWTGLLCYCELARRLSHWALCPMWIGGLLYSIGALISEFGWPGLWPGIFGAHELFHLFVMAASCCHYWFMLRVVVPFELPELVEEPLPRFVPEQSPA